LSTPLPSRLGRREIQILLALRDKSPRYVTAVYEEICKDANNKEACKAATRKAIKKLIEKGLVYRKKESKTLKFMIGLTREGKKLLLEFAPREW